jgi:tRNA modification GTPase
MDLASAEAVADLIASKTELSARAAVYQLQGGFSRKIQEWRKKLVDLIASLEAALDHAEEDISFISHKELEASLLLLWEQIQQLQATADKGRFLRDGMKMAIIGRPNAGKSSLMNALLDRDRSIVTDVPGTTRDTIEETMDFRGFPLVIVDTAGLRAHTHDPVEKLGQERTIASMETSDMILWVVDASEPLTDADQHIAKLLAVHGTDKRVFILFNKIDKGTVVSNRDIDCLFPAFGKVSVSAMTRAGFLELENAVISTIYSDVTFSGEPPLTNVRHRDILRRAADALGEALAAHSDKETEEVTSFHLRNALNILGEITGETAVDEILKNIFSRFCVGK